MTLQNYTTYSTHPNSPYTHLALCVVSRERNAGRPQPLFVEGARGGALLKLSWFSTSFYPTCYTGLSSTLLSLPTFFLHLLVFFLLQLLQPALLSSFSTYSMLPVPQIFGDCWSLAASASILGTYRCQFHCHVLSMTAYGRLEWHEHYR